VTILLSEQSPTLWRFWDASYDFLAAFQAHSKGAVVGKTFKALDIFGILLPPALRPKNFPQTASVNSEFFGIVKQSKIRKTKVQNNATKNNTCCMSV